MDYEPDEFHFSLVEVYGALSLKIENGYRGFHIPACFAIPEGVCAVTVNAGVSTSGAYVKYRHYDGADAQLHVTPKNSAVVLMARDGVYDFVLTTDYYEPVMATSNAMYGGTQAGANVGTKKNRARLRFVNDGTKVGFERNSQDNSTVNLQSKDEIYLEVSSLATNSDVKVTPSAGTLDGLTWTGNAEGVRFAVTATRYLAGVAVTVADKDESTTTLPDIEYVNCPNIAAFNALEDGTYALVSVDNAEVIGKSSDGLTTVYIQDATGGTALKYTSYNALLTENKRVFGRVYVRRMSSMMMEAEDSPKGEALPQDLDNYTITEGTLAQLNTTENLGRLVKISGASFLATSATAGTLTQGDATIAVNNGTASDIKYLHKMTDAWVKNETKLENVVILAILNAKNATTNELLPLSMEVDATGIVNAAANTEPLRIYNLQGVRLNQLQRGVNIVDGQLLMVK